jgi:hypothetical protein
MTSVPVSTIWRKQYHILYSKAGTILTLQKVSTFCLLQIHWEVHTEPIWYVFTQLRTSPISALYHSQYIVCEKCVSVECAEVSS